MNYQNHYNNLIERAKNRQIEGYIERHHILPRCLGGSDDKDNIVKLTAREHFLAHLLLLKIYPRKSTLIFAVQMMCIESPGFTRDRSKNRFYGWLREKFAEAMRQSQLGENNSQSGKIWIYSDELKKSRKINPLELESFESNGWKKGRKINFGDRKTDYYYRREELINPDPDSKNDWKSKKCKKCGSQKCEIPDVCNKHQMINTLSNHFGFDRSAFGSLKFYEEYDRIRKMIEDEYWVNGLSTVDIARKYDLKSSQRVDSIFKSLGIKARTYKEALRNYVDRN